MSTPLNPTRDALLYAHKWDLVAKAIRNEVSILQADLSRTTNPDERTRLYQAIAALDRVYKIVWPGKDDVIA